jgi:hypothetical protein
MRKYLIYGLLILVSFSIYAVSCKKTGKTSELIDPSLLSEDEDFVSLIVETNDFLGYLQQTIKQKKLSISDLQLKLNNISTNKLSEVDETNQIDELFQSAVFEKTKSHTKNFSDIWQRLKNKYGNISSADIEKETSEVFENKANFNKLKIPSSFSSLTESGCGGRYYLCMAGATAAGITCHAGCVGGTAGLGAPLCVLLCGSLQVSLSLDCSDRFCPQQ